MSPLVMLRCPKHPVSLSRIWSIRYSRTLWSYPSNSGPDQTTTESVLISWKASFAVSAASVRQPGTVTIDGTLRDQPGDIARGYVSVSVLNFVIGCGRVGIRTIQEPKDTSSYNKIYIADPDVSSKEQEEMYIASNAEYTQFAKDTIIIALKQTGPIPD